MNAFFSPVHTMVNRNATGGYYGVSLAHNDTASEIPATVR